MFVDKLNPDEFWIFWQKMDKNWAKIEIEPRGQHELCHQDIQLDKKIDDMDISFQGFNGMKTSGQKKCQLIKDVKMTILPLVCL